MRVCFVRHVSHDVELMQWKFRGTFENAETQTRPDAAFKWNKAKNKTTCVCIREPNCKKSTAADWVTTIVVSLL